MKRYIKNIAKAFRKVSRNAKKGLRGATRKMKKIFHRGGNPVAVAPPAPAVVPVMKPLSKRRRKSKGAIRRVTNAVRHVGKRVRNTITGIFSKKSKGTRRNKKRRVQMGSSENVLPLSMQPASNGIMPAPNMQPAMPAPNMQPAMPAPNVQPAMPAPNVQPPSGNIPATSPGIPPAPPV